MEIDGRTAVITGGASGMGRAMADRLGAAGARIVVADVEEPALDETVAALLAAGVDALGVVCDVSDGDAMDTLAATANEHFGPVDIACLNAGVGSNGPMAELRTADWEWVLGVNLWGVIHGIRVFLPDMEARDQGHVVITASIAGLTSYPYMGPYNASKHAAVTIAETLHHEQRAKGSSVHVTALCPGLVRTRILDADRNRPERYRLPALDTTARLEREYGDVVRDIYSTAMAPAAVADMVHDAIRDGTFYLLTDTVFDEAIAGRHRAIEARAQPELGAGLLETHVLDQRRPPD